LYIIAPIFLATSTIPESLLSLSLISLAIGFSICLLYYQFVKLAEIAEEIENSEEFKEK